MFIRNEPIDSYIRSLIQADKSYIHECFPTGHPMYIIMYSNISFLLSKYKLRSLFLIVQSIYNQLTV